MKRYEIQVCDLECARKSRVVWQEITTARTLWGAKRRYEEVVTRTHDLSFEFRILDRKTGKAVW